MFTERVHSRSAKREATRQKVLAAAERLFRTQGFRVTTIRQIAADAGVSTGTVMAVGEKDALLVAIFDGWIASVHRGRDTGHDADRTSLPATATVGEVMDLFEPFIRYFAVDPELSREYAAVIVRGNHESAIFQNLALALIAELEAVLSRSAFTRADAGCGARAVYFAYLGLLMTAANGAIETQDAIDELRQVVSFVVSHSGGEE
ncbi:TetR/AcrR family transcriptional regulator [Actinoallomurus oryzae]|jgi:AcrR family transcriptional regulator|uniref:TetR/AcrR family transcriptional regulator n=1 Tax=Actinoallomurus oryzae TaxID=502180 RepID=UPI0031E9DF35